MTGQKGDGDTVMLEDCNGCRGVAPRRGGVDYCDWLVAVELLQTGAADYGYVNWSWG